MTDVLPAGRSPIAVETEAGKTYWWCTCGRSANQPFCDGSHKGTEFTPQRWEAEQSETRWFCACKRTANAPFCDGSHKGLPT
jgi:CDGSH-type Zn-finger protein